MGSDHVVPHGSPRRKSCNARPNPEDSISNLNRAVWIRCRVGLTDCDAAPCNEPEC